MTLWTKKEVLSTSLLKTQNKNNYPINTIYSVLHFLLIQLFQAK